LECDLEVSNCTGIEWMHWHRNMNGMITLWNFNSKALVRAMFTLGLAAVLFQSPLHTQGDVYGTNLKVTKQQLLKVMHQG